MAAITLQSFPLTTLQLEAVVMKKCPLGNEPCREWEDEQAILFCAKAHSNRVERCIGMALAMERTKKMETQPIALEAEQPADTVDNRVMAMVMRLLRTVTFKWGMMGDTVGLSLWTDGADMTSEGTAADIA
jgi:hypothetical protein